MIKNRINWDSDTPPVLAVSNTIIEGRIAETILPIKAAGTLGKSRIKLVHYHLVTVFALAKHI